VKKLGVPFPRYCRCGRRRKIGRLTFAISGKEKGLGGCGQEGGVFSGTHIPKVFITERVCMLDGESTARLGGLIKRVCRDKLGGFIL